MKAFKFAFLLAAAAILTGCAHNVTIAPALTVIERPADAKAKHPINVGYYIPESLRAQQVTTPGGGGDKVTSVPYRDIEPGLYKMLSNVFNGVTSLKNPADQEAIAKNGISLVITPQITPNSSSSSMLTWPPTDFSIELQCTIADATGKVIDTRKVTGTGQADFAAFKSELGLSGRLAAQDALLKMQASLLEAKLP